MKVCVEERHYSSTKDVEGYVYDRNSMDDESAEFEKYLDEFHVLDKYREGKTSEGRNFVMKGEGQFITGDAYFNGWRHLDGERPRNEMCYIIIERTFQ